MKNRFRTVLQRVVKITFSSIPAIFLAAASVVCAADSGGHASGGGGCGDVFGDLVHILRDPDTGQPILQKRTILGPQDVLLEAYCPIPVDIEGNEIALVDLSCDPIDTEAVVEVDYFGRLSGGRTKERNSRMHFDEVIANIKMADKVSVEETGRLSLGFDCVGDTCSWSTIDSPMESLALYTRLMKYGHLQTDPMEIDTFAHGDPALPPQYHPALDQTDRDKFSPELQHLLSVGLYSYYPESLESEDFMRAASFLGTAANKTGIITVDLVQYMNRILKIAMTTETSEANPDLLGALIRDCGDIGYGCSSDTEIEIYEASGSLPSPANEKFVDYGAANYLRKDWFEKNLTLLVPTKPSTPLTSSWKIFYDIQLIGWLNNANGPSTKSVVDVNGFVAAASDALRSIELVHNYAIPDYLGWDFKP